MATNLTIEAPAFSRIRKGDFNAIEDAVTTLWLVANSLSAKQLADEQSLAIQSVWGVQSDSPSGTQNDYDTKRNGMLLLGSAGAWNLTGLRNGQSGMVRLIVNLGVGTMTAKHATGSSASNQLAMAGAADKAVATNQCLLLVYLNSRWREVALA